MPEKLTTVNEVQVRYHIDGKTFTWTTEDGNTISIPMRIKLKVIRKLAKEELDNAATMFAILEQIIPGEADALDEMDVNDFAAMFSAWQEEYQALAGASLGESLPSTG
jgi:hypothetical protein